MSALVEIPHVIDGEERPAADGRTFESVNPATEAAWARVARGSAADADAAVGAARRAFDDGPWPRMGPAERARALHRLADLIEAEAAELGRLDSTDMGKPIREARDNDAPRAALNFRFFADYAALATDEALPSPDRPPRLHPPRAGRGRRGDLALELPPHAGQLEGRAGPGLRATPWSSSRPSSPRRRVTASACWPAEAGLPPGALNVVHGFGPGEAGQALTEHPGVDRSPSPASRPPAGPSWPPAPRP